MNRGDKLLPEHAAVTPDPQSPGQLAQLAEAHLSEKIF
jgi:hypothetical protein